MNERRDHSDKDDEDVEHIDGEAVERAPKRLRRWMGMNPATLITDATKTVSQHRHQREVVYIVLQFLRIPLLAAALVAWGIFDLWWLGLILLLISVPLPGLAVVIANEQAVKRDKRSRATYKPGLARMEQRQREELVERERKALEPPEPPQTIDEIKDENEDH